MIKEMIKEYENKLILSDNHLEEVHDILVILDDSKDKNDIIKFVLYDNIYRSENKNYNIIKRIIQHLKHGLISYDFIDEMNVLISKNTKQCNDIYDYIKTMK